MAIDTNGFTEFTAEERVAILANAPAMPEWARMHYRVQIERELGRNNDPDENLKRDLMAHARWAVEYLHILAKELDQSSRS